MTDLSLILPTFNRADMLGDVLRGLTSQTANPGTYEVIVIDDGSTDETAAVTRSFQGSATRVRYVHQENAGLNTGRNRGAEEADADLLSYLDDDVYVGPDFVSALLTGFATHADAQALGGRIVLHFEGPVPSWLTSRLRLYLSEFDRGDNVEVLNAPEYPRGANFAVRRELVARVGGFVPALDRRGTSLISSGEQEFFQRVHRAEQKIVYWPTATVRHRVPPERLTVDYFRRRARAQGVSDALLESARRSPQDLSREVIRTARILPITAQGLARGWGTINARLWWAYCQGRLKTTWDSGR